MKPATHETLVQEGNDALLAAETLSGAASKTPEELANIVSRFASSDGWMEKVRLRSDQRWYERLSLGPDHDIWIISWLQGSRPVSTTTVHRREPSS
jgi:hypothetical protein